VFSLNLALLDTQGHALAVDVTDVEPADCSAPKARSINAFLNAMEAALTASALIGPVTNWSMSSLGIDGIAAAAAKAALVVFLVLGIHAPVGHAMPRTQNSAHAPL
jgi:hypothetical protein